jgi:septal ring factor EnvC (AmiA/AmiB activator)
MQALDEARRRAQQELKTSERLAADQQQNLEVRSHVLTLREGELDSRLRNRDRTIDDLNLRLRELTNVLRKEQATRESLVNQISELNSARVRRSPRAQKRAAPKRKAKARKLTKSARPKPRKRR